MKIIAAILIFFCFALPIRSKATPRTIETFSLVAYDPITEQWGVAVQSKAFAVGAVVPYAEAGTGAIASQARANTAFGPKALELMRLGVSADDVMKYLLAADANKESRQVGIVDANGSASTFTGNLCQAWAGGIKGEFFCVQGNILANEHVVKAMADGYLTTSGTLAERLLAALQAGQDAGGDKRGMQSAALLVVAEQGGYPVYSGYNDRMIDIRIDDHPTPIKELSRLYAILETKGLPEAYVYMSCEAHEKGKKGKADALLANALAIADRKNDDPAMLNGIAWELALNNYQLETALKLAQRAVDLSEGKNANILDTLAETYARSGYFKKAIEIETKANTISPNNDFLKKIDLWKQKKIQ